MTELFEPLPESAATRRKENTRTRLVRASLDVFVDKGIDAATVDDLVKAAGFTRGAFYSSFTHKEEVFLALFDEVTTELLAIADAAVGRAMQGDPHGPGEGADMRQMLAVFEGIRPFGRQWSLLYTEATARSLRDAEMRAALAHQLGRMRERIGALLEHRLAATGERALLPTADLAQLLTGIFTDLMLREQLEGRDVTDVATTTILGTLNAFVAARKS